MAVCKTAGLMAFWPLPVRESAGQDVQQRMGDGVFVDEGGGCPGPVTGEIGQASVTYFTRPAGLALPGPLWNSVIGWVV